jgi:hypothetical protein
MTNQMIFIFIFILFAAAAYGSRRDSASGRPRIRHITAYGAAFCVLSFNLWAVTRMDAITATLPGPHDKGIFSTPWPWVSALCVGVALLIISFFTRVRHGHAA